MPRSAGMINRLGRYSTGRYASRLAAQVPRLGIFSQKGGRTYERVMEDHGPGRAMRRTALVRTSTRLVCQVLAAN